MRVVLKRTISGQEYKIKLTDEEIYKARHFFGKFINYAAKGVEFKQKFILYKEVDVEGPDNILRVTFNYMELQKCWEACHKETSKEFRRTIKK